MTTFSLAMIVFVFLVDTVLLTWIDRIKNPKERGLFGSFFLASLLCIYIVAFKTIFFSMFVTKCGVHKVEVLFSSPLEATLSCYPEHKDSVYLHKHCDEGYSFKTLLPYPEHLCKESSYRVHFIDENTRPYVECCSYKADPWTSIFYDSAKLAMTETCLYIPEKGTCHIECNWYSTEFVEYCPY